MKLYLDNCMFNRPYDDQYNSTESGLGHASAQKYALVNGQSGSPP